MLDDSRHGLISKNENEKVSNLRHRIFETENERDAKYETWQNMRQYIKQYMRQYVRQ